MDINEAINELAETLVELVERDRNYQIACNGRQRI